MKQIKKSSTILLITAIFCIFEGVNSNTPPILYLGIFLAILSAVRYLMVINFAKNGNDLTSQDDDSVMRYLLKDEVLYADMIAVYKQDNCDVLYDETDGILLYEHTSQTYLASANKRAGAIDILNEIPQDYKIFIAHDHIFEEFANTSFNYKHVEYKYNYVYQRKEYFVVKESDIVFKNLDSTHVPMVKKHCSLAEGFSSNYLDKRVEVGMLGAFMNDDLVGFVGIHENNALGMLEIFNDYRHLGIGLQLQCTYINQLLKDKSKVPVYTQVNASNEESMKLHEKLYFTKAVNSCIWYFN